MYYNCLLTRLWRHNIWNNLIFVIKPFCYMTKKSRQKVKYLENEKSFWSEHSSSFLRVFSCQNLSQTWECTFNWISKIIYMTIMALLFSGYHYCITSFKKVWTQVLRRFRSCSRHVGDSRCWGSLTMVPAGNKAKRYSSVNHTTKTIHHLHIIIINHHHQKATGAKLICLYFIVWS